MSGLVSNNKLNPWLDICRAVAIIFVIISHGRGFLFPKIQQLETLGYFGVDIFFILSGFLIGKILINSSENSGGSFKWIPLFWARRWMRTYPSYVLFLIINIAIVYSSGSELPINLINYFTFTQALTSPHPDFFGESWSLAVEEVFYLLAPLVIYFSMKISKNTKKYMIITIITFLIIPTLTRVYLSINTEWTFRQIRFLTLSRLDSIMLGVLLSLLYYKYQIRKHIKLTAIILFPLSIFSLYLTSTPEYLLNNSTLSKIFIFNISMLGAWSIVSIGLNFNITHWINSIFSHLARWSYAAYLVNLPVRLYMQKIIPSPTNAVEGIFQFTIFFVVTFIFSFFIYYFFERKVLKIRDSITMKEARES